MHGTRSILFVGSLAVLAVVVWFLYRESRTESAVADTASPSAIEIAQSLNKLQLMTMKPVLVSPEFAFFCVPTTQETVEREKQRAGPHAHTAIRVYMNDLAADAFHNLTNRYPIGSVVVKEKMAGGYISDFQSPDNTGARNGVGGMIKRPPGYDPAHRDWEYFYADGGNHLESGRIPSCVDCHQAAADSDHVFGSWSERTQIAQ